MTLPAARPPAREAPPELLVLARFEEFTGWLLERTARWPKERATMLAPTSEGLPFLGWHLFPGTMRVRPANLRRYRWRLRLRRYEMEAGRRSAASYRQGVASMYELLHHGDTLALRRGIVAADGYDP